MKKILVIGSTAVDVILRLDHLPVTGEDINVSGQWLSLGGCAYNASDMIRRFGVPYILFSPVGTGTYGDFVRARLREKGIPVVIPTPEQENGCCYCLVEAGGERTFLSCHGAEYRFRREWFDRLDPGEISEVYLCGLEVEEPTGDVILDFLERHPAITPFFAPGPRISSIGKEKMRRLLALRPVLHLNAQEAAAAAAEYAGQPPADVREAAHALQRLTGNTVIVTLGAEGSCYDTGAERGLIPGSPVSPVDTIGAGDAHIGAVMALLHAGMPLPEALRAANRAAAAVVGVRGALLNDAEFAAAFPEGGIPGAVPEKNR